MGLEYQPQLNLVKMPHISYLAYKFSSVTEDHITIGLLYSNEEGMVTPFISEMRLKMLRKLISPYMHNHFLKYVKAIQNNKITYSDLDYQSRYQNGYIKVTCPKPTSGNEEEIKRVFEKYINLNYNENARSLH